MVIRRHRIRRDGLNGSETAFSLPESMERQNPHHVDHDTNIGSREVSPLTHSGDPIRPFGITYNENIHESGHSARLDQACLLRHE